MNKIIADHYLSAEEIDRLSKFSNTLAKLDTPSREYAIEFFKTASTETPITRHKRMNETPRRFDTPECLKPSNE